jgi:type I restriction enzyme S subunit
MLSRDFYMQADSVALGAAQRTISLTSLRNMKVQLPNLDIQRRIAEVLSRYDALIENYQRQIKLLEEAAQRLYKEWFVDLRFPGHQSTPIINNLAQSWPKKKLGAIAEFKRGKTITKKEIIDSMQK